MRRESLEYKKLTKPKKGIQYILWPLNTPRMVMNLKATSCPSLFKFAVNTTFLNWVFINLRSGEGERGEGGGVMRIAYQHG